MRVLTTKDGGKFTEELVAFDAASRSYQYQILESPVPVTDYVSTIEVKESQRAPPSCGVPASTSGLVRLKPR